MRRILITLIACVVAFGLLAISDVVAGKGRETAQDEPSPVALVETGFAQGNSDGPSVNMSDLDRRHYKMAGARTLTLTYNDSYVGTLQTTCGEARITPYYVCMKHDLVGLSSNPIYCHTDLWEPEPGGGKIPKIKSTNVSMYCWDSNYVTQLQFTDTVAMAKLRFPVTREEFEKFEATVDLSNFLGYDAQMVFTGKQLGRYPSYESVDSPGDHQFELPYPGLRLGQ